MRERKRVFLQKMAKWKAYGSSHQITSPHGFSWSLIHPISLEAFALLSPVTPSVSQWQHWWWPRSHSSSARHTKRHKHSCAAFSTWVTSKFHQVQNFSNKSQLALVSYRTWSTTFKHATKPGQSMKHYTQGLHISFHNTEPPLETQHYLFSNILNIQ